MESFLCYRPAGHETAPTRHADEGRHSRLRAPGPIGKFLLSVVFALAASSPSSAQPPRQPVNTIADARLAIGNAELPLYVSRDWTHPLPGLRRAILIVHGYLRNADAYFQTALRAQHAADSSGADTLIIAPQFLSGTDITAHHLSGQILHWSLTGWEGGEPAQGPTHSSSFDAFDTILMHLSDRHLFPNLITIVIAGHSGGAQVVQRYAVLGHGETYAKTAGIHIRYVVANPSSYAWFGAERPEPAIAAACPGYNQWKYGTNGLPPYAAGQPITALEQQYAARGVIYLLGTRDTNPNHPALDKTCMAEAQGPSRYARRHAYYAALRQLFGPALHQQIYDVPGVGHNGDRMFTSACGLSAVFDKAGCGG
jgi:pimeloyl-ACP methyl ester carboxylesterase